MFNSLKSSFMSLSLKGKAISILVAAVLGYFFLGIIGSIISTVFAIFICYVAYNNRTLIKGMINDNKAAKSRW